MDREAASREAADPGAATRKRHRARAKAAWEKRSRWNKVLLDVYDYVAPHRRSTRLMETDAASRVSKLFDPHAANVLHRVVGRLLEDVFPSGESIVWFEPGPAVKDDDQADARTELESLANLINPNFWFGDFDNAIAGVMTDGLISTGYLLTLKGDAAQPINFVNIPHDEMAHDSGPYNRTHGYFWKRKWTRRAIMEAFPNGRYEAEFKQKAETESEEQVVLCQDVLFDAARKKWKLIVYLESCDTHDIWEEESATSPILDFSYFKLPGDDYGFGPVLINLPIIKTLNKTVELALKGAALNALGIYTRIDDGVFNVDTARLEPGAFWQVARNGGALGPSIQRLPASSDPNLSMMTINDMRLSISQGMHDDELPEKLGTPRSAAEIIERSRRLRKNHAGAFSRIVNDLFLALLPRMMEILKDAGILKNVVTIDQLRVRLKIISPLGQAYRAKRAETFIEWAEIAASLAPGSLGVMTPIEKSLVQVGYDMGVPASQLLAPTEQDAFKQRVAEGVAAALEQMKGQKEQPPPVNGDPAQGAAA